MELVGSDEDRSVKKEAAKEEPMWQGAGESPGLKIWRIEQFNVRDWPKEDYGRFYDGDSYIILNTYMKNDKLLFDVHFWIGKNSTADEYGAAAYKTVELDTYLDDVPVQHRECQGHESKLFLSYFQRFETLKGGVATGFKHVTPEEYKPRLLLFSGTGKNITVKQIPISKGLDSTDVFLLDMGVQIIQWNGKESNMFERHKASISTKKLFKLSDSSGSLERELVADTEGKFDKSDLNSTAVFIVDTGKECIVWLGRRSSDREKSSSSTYAHNYLKSTSHPLIPVTCLNEGAEDATFLSLFTA